MVMLNLTSLPSSSVFDFCNEDCIVVIEISLFLKVDVVLSDCIRFNVNIFPFSFILAFSENFILTVS